MSLISQLQFWTLTDDIKIPDSDAGCSKLYDKNAEFQAQEHPYIAEKEAYIIGRGVTWTPRNKRPDKIRESLKEFENTLSTQKCVGLVWSSPNVIQFFFNKGLLVLVQLTNSVNIERITFDRYLVGKLASDNVTDVDLDENRILIAYGDAKLTYIYFGKKQSSSNDKWEKLSSQDPRLVTIELVGPVNRKFDRRLSTNGSKDCLLIWWPTRSFDLWPWMPLTSDRERANAVIYALTGSSMEMLSYAKTEGELVSACFSQQYDNRVSTVEEHISKNDKISVNVCTYHVAKGRFQQVALTAIPLQGHVACCQWSPQGDHLLIACSDMSVIVFDKSREITKVTTALFVPIEVAWHRGGVIAALASEKGQLQCFDIALSTIQLQILSDDDHPLKKLEISAYFRKQPLLLRLLWEPVHGTSTCSSLCFLFESGPVALLNFSTGAIMQGIISPIELVSQYLKSGSVDEAVGLLKSLNWSFQAEICYRCTMRIINFLLRRPLNEVTEVQIENALGTFYELGQPLPESIIAEYRDRVGRLARRFFHQLLRHERLEKAFLLAVDLGCRDLFLDLHHIAITKGETSLANVALQKADQLDTRSMTSTSCEESVEEESSELSDDQISVRDEQFSAFSRSSGRKSTREPSEFLVASQEHRNRVLEVGLQKIPTPKRHMETTTLSPMQGSLFVPQKHQTFPMEIPDTLHGPSEHYSPPIVPREQYPLLQNDHRRFHTSQFQRPRMQEDIPPPLPPRSTPERKLNQSRNLNDDKYDAKPSKVVPESLHSGDPVCQYDFQGNVAPPANIPLRTLSLMHRQEQMQVSPLEVVRAQHAIVTDDVDEESLEDGHVKCVHFGIV